MTMMTPTKPTAVFDIGQVLLRWDPVNSFTRLLGDPERARAVMDEIDFHGWHAHQDAGRLVADAVADHVSRFPHHGEVISAYYDNWLDSVPGEVPGTRALFETLADQGPVFGISNFSREMFDRTVPAYPFLKRFTDLVLSADVRINKPDPRIYRILAERNGLTPSSLIFIDDNPANVAAAQAEGWDGIVFTDAPSLSAALRARGLEV
ncbi:HAD family phosphatase [Phreatobacter aquaticus]|uniref:HAD family phosphatase n=1 Tax=Phreatobacter aquaticus TaxID=2570229 RepID=A0A4D7QEE4_9HYPH|nr:HAD family phosphatase [Phreatobacter aquaticus]QCK86360.1 HAD family phosphatase [Phreatobacter aquaticus]